MPWSGGNFTQKVGPSPIFTGPTVWEQDAAAGILIEAARHDYHDQDLADGIDACINKNGANSPTSDINWGGFQITNIGAGATSTAAANVSQTVTAASLDSGTNILTLTRGAGDVTVDLSSLAVGGSTTDFARYSNSLNPFQGSAYFAGSGGVGLKNALTILDPLTSSGVTYTWALSANTATSADWGNTAGAVLNFSGNSGSATLKVNGSAVWTAATLPASTFTGALTQTGGPYTVTGTWAVTAPWTFTNPNLKLPGFQWSAGTGGTTWTAGPLDANTLSFTEPGGTKNLVYVIDSSTVAGAYIQIGASAKRVWDRGNLPTLLTAAPSNVTGEDGDGAFVISGADKGVWVKVSGTWTKIAS